jgi:N-acetylglucosamine-6-phosphate deacetylase
VLVSLGHSDTGAAEARAGFAAGARCVTHLFNAMSGLGHREPGLVGATLDAERVSCGLIADGVHVAPEVIRVALAAKRGADRVFLVSDAMPVAGTELDGFSLGGRRILRHGGRLTLEDGTLAGADIDLAGSVRVLVRHVGVPLGVALAMASRVPAALIGRGDLGRLAPGLAADLVYLDEGLGLAGVWRAGKPIALHA